VRQQLLDAIYSGQSFRTALRDLGLTSNQVWGLTKTDEKWSAALEAALMATRRDHLQHGTNAAYARGCVCRECREHQRRRTARNRAEKLFRCCGEQRVSYTEVNCLVRQLGSFALPQLTQPQSPPECGPH
jgi:hypothetical protein